MLSQIGGVGSKFFLTLRSCTTLELGKEHLSLQASPPEKRAKRHESDVDTEFLNLTIGWLTNILETIQFLAF